MDTGVRVRLPAAAPPTLLEFVFEIAGGQKRMPLARLWVDATPDDVPADDLEVVLNPLHAQGHAEWRGMLMVRTAASRLDHVWFRLRVVSDPGLAWRLRAFASVTGGRTLIHESQGLVHRPKITLAVECEIPVGGPAAIQGTG